MTPKKIETKYLAKGSVTLLGLEITVRGMEKGVAQYILYLLGHEEQIKPCDTDFSKKKTCVQRNPFGSFYAKSNYLTTCAKMHKCHFNFDSFTATYH